MNIKLIGIGGIGTGLLSFLPRYLAHQRADEVTLILIDGDTFEARNEDRQAFREQGNKAVVKAAEQLVDFPSLTTLAVPEYVTPQNIQEIVEEGDIVLLAVDNHATRKLVSDRCRQLANVVLISAGNDLETGNAQIYIRREGENLTNPIDEFHPEIANPADHNPGVDLNCLAQAEEGDPQIVITNMAAAVSMACYLYQFLEERQPADEVYFNIGTSVFARAERSVMHGDSGNGQA